VPQAPFIAFVDLQNEAEKLFAKTLLVVILNGLTDSLDSHFAVYCRGPRGIRPPLLRKDAAMAENKDSDLQKIKKLIEIMKQNKLVEVEIKHGDDKIFLKRCQPQQPAVTALPTIGPESGVAPVGPNATQNSAALSQPSALQRDEDLAEIKSPIVGTFYVTPSPDSEPYVELDSAVKPQTVVCIIEAMKVMNEIKAETSGTIVEILVTNGQAVEYGQVLFRVKPD
jgi:acetyl-CoA carboxylase biotin carboxyl carrier protein